MSEQQTPHILVIDDDDLLRRSLVESMKSAGYRVLDAKNGSDGLALALESHPEMIFLDYQMPGTNGVEVLTELRKDDWGKKVEVVFATNVYDMAVVNEVLAMGVHDYILKADSSLEQIVDVAKKYVNPKS
jgi:CheY-like chemotaxis protein